MRHNKKFNIFVAGIPVWEKKVWDNVILKGIKKKFFKTDQRNQAIDPRNTKSKKTH